MCGVSGVGGVAGGGAIGQVGQMPGHVAGDHGGMQMPPTKDTVAQGGGPTGAVAGASGGGGVDLSGVLNALTQAVTALNELIKQMSASTAGGGGGDMSGCGGDMAGHVMGVQGEAASEDQYVTRIDTPVYNTSNSEDDAFEQEVLELINQERAKYGLQPVRYSGVLDQAAEKHAGQMAMVRAMAHDGIGDGTSGERIRAEGFRNAWGENVATGQTSAAQVVREWMNSPDHRRNILDSNFTQMGVGLTMSADGRSYWAQEFGA